MDYSRGLKYVGALVSTLIALTAVAIFAEASVDKHDAAGATHHMTKSGPTMRSTSSRIEVVVMENQNYQDVIGSKNAPYTNHLANRYGLATHMYAVTHPSLPNYLAMTTGRTFGLETDSPGRPLPGSDLMTQLDDAGSSWHAYFAGVPKSCYAGPPVNGYSRGLNPFILNRRILANKRSCSNLRPMSSLSSELVSGNLPDLAWISPSLTEDSHDSTVKAGDTYLARLVPRLIPSLGPRGVLFVIWDEGKTAHSKGKTSIGINGTKGGGHIPAIVVGPGVHRGARTSTPMTSYSMLHFIEHSFGLPYLNHAATMSDSPLRSLFRTQPKPQRSS